MAARKRLSLGQSDFKKLRTTDSYFVDKSLFIHDIIEAEHTVLLFPRPRRFGKTLNLSMLRYYFDNRNTQYQELFKGLKIWDCDEDIKSHCGKYPVISISFKDAKADTWEKCYEHLVSEVIELYREHRYLMEGDTLFTDEKADFNAILTEKASEVKYQNCLKQLSNYLARFHKQDVVILIDEYDTPIQAGYGSYYTQVISFMRNMLSSAFKDNEYLYKGVITGILRVPRESIFSGLNNLSVFSSLDYEFSDSFGFTELEVQRIVSDFQIKTPFNQIRTWYNGYQFGDVTDIYNPWSVLNFTANKREQFKTFWTNSSSNDLIKTQIKKNDADSIREDLLLLINGDTIVKTIEENFVFTDLDTRKEVLWTLLVHSGYLTTKNFRGRKKYELRIPNYEIKTVFQDTIIDWLETKVRIVQSLLEKTASYLVSGDLVNFEQGFRQILGDTFSYYDTAKANEYVYHSYILGLLAIIGDDYLIKSNKESGEGRYDIMLIPHDRTMNGVVIEIKQIDKQTEKESNTEFTKRVNGTIEGALAQIDRNKYYKELLDCKVLPENIVKVPVVFAGKEAFVCPTS